MKTNLAVYILLLSALAACGDPDYPTATPSVVVMNPAKVTVVHTHPAVGRIQIKVDNKATPKDTLRFEKAPNGNLYNSIKINIPAGPNRLLGFADLGTGASLITDRFTAPSGQNFTIFLSHQGDLTPRIVRVTDDLSLPDPGVAKVRFLNFSDDVGEVKLTEMGGANDFFTGRKFNAVASGDVDFAKFTLFPAGTYSYEVRTVDNDQVVLTLNDLILDSKGIYTIYVKGSVNGTGDRILDYDFIKH